MDMLLLVAVVVLALLLGGLRTRVGKLEGDVRQLRKQLDAVAEEHAIWQVRLSMRAPASAAPAPDVALAAQASPAPALDAEAIARVQSADDRVAAAVALATQGRRSQPLDAERASGQSPLPHAQVSVNRPVQDAAARQSVPLQPSQGARYAPPAAGATSAVSAAATATAAEAAELDWSVDDESPRRAASVNWVDAVKGWFTTGNVPVKVGMLVLLAGLAALLRYASVQGWVSLPMWARLSGIGAVALGALAFGWRQRERKPAFAVALQGGALGALLLTVFAAFKLYGLMGPVTAFALSAALIAAVATMATLQNALTLAVISVLAGFLAPIWLSTASGNHVALFSYYALLNVGILAMAWHRPWRLLNLIGFAFTWAIGVLWGVLDYAPEKLASTQPFLLLFFAFYLALPVLYARKAPAREGDRIDGSLLFGTPLMAFSLQAALLEGARWPLAGCAVALALIYAAIAWVLSPKPRYAALGRVHWVLAVGFATLAVPLAFSAQITGSVFAVEGAALIWLGLRQRHALPQWAGAALQVLAACALVLGHALESFTTWVDGLLGSWVGWLTGQSPAAGEAASQLAVFNAAFMSGFLLALSGFVSAWLYAKARKTAPAALAYGWGLLCWVVLLWVEVRHHVPSAWLWQFVLMAIALTVSLLAQAQVRGRFPQAPALAWTALGAVGVALLCSFAFWLQQPVPWAISLLAWSLFSIAVLRGLQVFAHWNWAWAVRIQAAWLGLLPWVLCLFLMHAWPSTWRNTGWSMALGVLPWLGLLLWSMKHWRSLSWPLGEGHLPQLRNPNRPRLQMLWFVLVALWWLAALWHSGRIDPLPWVPLLNPLDAVQLGALALLAHWLRTPREALGVPEPLSLRTDPLSAWRRKRGPMLAAGVLLLSTAITLRTVHHWGGAPWDETLWQMGATQTALTVVWSVLGMLCWVLGSRRGLRGLWLLGAALMGVVLVKLLLVDRENLGDLLGIGAFIAYGLLCTLVGWLAPAPPKAQAAPPTT